MHELYIEMKSGSLHIYKGKEAEEVFQAIDSAGARGADWASIRKDSEVLVYVLDNIGMIRFQLTQMNNEEMIH